MLTEANLAEAFAGESQANRKYLAFALQADLEGPAWPYGKKRPDRSCR